MTSRHIESTHPPGAIPGRPRQNGIWSRFRRWTSRTSRSTTHDNENQLTGGDRNFRRTLPRLAPSPKGGHETVTFLNVHDYSQAVAALRLAQELAEASRAPVADRITESNEHHQRQLKWIQDDLNNARSHWEDVHRREIHDADSPAGPLTCSRCRQDQLELVEPRNSSRSLVDKPDRLGPEGWDITEQGVLQALTLPHHTSREGVRIRSRRPFRPLIRQYNQQLHEIRRTSGIEDLSNAFSASGGPSSSSSNGSANGFSDLLDPSGNTITRRQMREMVNNSPNTQHTGDMSNTDRTSNSSDHSEPVVELSQILDREGIPITRAHMFENVNSSHKFEDLDQSLTFSLGSLPAIFMGSSDEPNIEPIPLDRDGSAVSRLLKCEHVNSSRLTEDIEDAMTSSIIPLPPSSHGSFNSETIDISLLDRSGNEITRLQMHENVNNSRNVDDVTTLTKLEFNPTSQSSSDISSSVYLDLPVAHADDRLTIQLATDREANDPSSNSGKIQSPSSSLNHHEHITDVQYTKRDVDIVTEPLAPGSVNAFQDAQKTEEIANLRTSLQTLSSALYRSLSNSVREARSNMDQLGDVSEAAVDCQQTYAASFSRNLENSDGHASSSEESNIQATPYEKDSSSLTQNNLGVNDAEGLQPVGEGQYDECDEEDGSRSLFSSNSNEDLACEQQSRSAEFEEFSRHFNIAIGQNVPIQLDATSSNSHYAEDLDPARYSLPPSRPGSSINEPYELLNPYSEDGQLLLNHIRRFFSIPLEESFEETRKRILNKNEPIYLDLYESIYNWTREEEIPYIVQPNSILHTPRGPQRRIPEKYGAWGDVKRELSDVWALEMVRDKIASIDWFPDAPLPPSPKFVGSFSFGCGDLDVVVEEDEEEEEDLNAECGSDVEGSVEDDEDEDDNDDDDDHVFPSAIESPQVQSLLLSFEEDDIRKDIEDRQVSDASIAEANSSLISPSITRSLSHLQYKPSKSSLLRNLVSRKPDISSTNEGIDESF